jgi:hypothetical protein
VAGKVILNLIDSKKDLKAVFVFGFFYGFKIKETCLENYISPVWRTSGVSGGTPNLISCIPLRSALQWRHYLRSIDLYEKYYIIQANLPIESIINTLLNTLPGA